MKTLSTLSSEEWEEIREQFGVSKVLVWRAPTPDESRRRQGKPVGTRRLDDGSFEIQINADAIRCRPRSVPKEQFTLYCLYTCMAHIALGHLDEQNQQEWLKSRIRTGRRMGLKTLRTELDAEASAWALERLTRPESAATDTTTPAGVDLQAS